MDLTCASIFPKKTAMFFCGGPSLSSVSLWVQAVLMSSLSSPFLSPVAPLPPTPSPYPPPFFLHLSSPLSRVQPIPTRVDLRIPTCPWRKTRRRLGVKPSARLSCSWRGPRSAGTLSESAPCPPSLESPTSVLRAHCPVCLRRFPAPFSNAWVLIKLCRSLIKYGGVLERGSI